MASSKKRAHLTLETPEDTSSSESSGGEEGEGVSSSDEMGGIQNGQGGGLAAESEIQVEFEARTPESCHFHGVLRLLQGLFKYPHDIPLAQLAETLIQQRQVGSVVTQSADTDDEDDEEEELAAGMNPDFSANNDVFGLLTLFNISDHTPLARAVVKYLDSIALKESDKIFLKSLTQGGGPGAQSAGLIISERIVNLPSQISVPLFETLFSEIQKAKARGLPFNFQHYVLITQVLKEDGPGPAQGDHFVKVEEEIIQEHAERVIETMPAGYGGTKPASLRGNDVYEPNWRILVLAENKSQVVMEAIKTAFPI